MKIKSIIACSVLSMALVGCGKNHVADGNQLKSGSIVGGTAVSSSSRDFRSVVGIVKNGQIICTGNLISRTEILTAAHCVTPFGAMLSRGNAANATQALLNKVGPKVDAELAQTETPFSSLSASEKRDIIARQLPAVLQEEARGIKIHFGVGQAGGRASGGKSVSRMQISSDSINYIKANFLSHTNLGTASDRGAARYSEIKDQVVLKLSSPVTDVTPVQLISPSEHSQVVRIGGSVKVVGFGLQIDERFLTSSQAILQELRQKIDNESDSSKKAELQTQYDQELQTFRQYYVLYQNSGNKNQVDLVLEHYDHTHVVLKNPSREFLHGACSGDSGGPAFVRLRNGQLRQMGVMVTVDYCGNKTNLAPVFRR